MDNKLSKHKRIGMLSIVFILIFVISFLFGYLFSGFNSGKEKKHEAWKETNFYSEIAEENCIICKTRKMYINEDNLGIIFLNDGTVNHIGINKYDDHGKLVESKDTFSQMLITPADSGETGIRIDTNRDRGYSNVDIDLGDNTELDMDKVRENCCEQCIEQILDDYYSEQPYDILVLNCKTGDTKLITSSIMSFTLDDYYISCEQRTKNGEKEISEVDLLIFYCPERYNNK